MPKGNKKKRILVTGASGVVGMRVADRLHEDGYDIFGSSHRYVRDDVDYPYKMANLGDARSTFDLIHEFNPDVVIHTAANSNIDICELYQEQAWVTNVIAVKNLIGLSLLFGYRLIFFSSEQVYGEHPEGKEGMFNEESELVPDNFYGKSKIFSEEDIIQHLNDYVILRLALVYGWGNSMHFTWCDGLLEDLEDNIPSKLYSDQLRSMIFADDIPGIICSIIDDPEIKGIFNLGGSESIMRDEFGKRFARNWNFDEELIASVSMDNAPLSSPRPKNCALDLLKIKTALDFEPSSLEEGLKHMKENNPHPPLEPVEKE